MNTDEKHQQDRKMTPQEVLYRKVTTALRIVVATIQHPSRRPNARHSSEVLYHQTDVCQGGANKRPTTLTFKKALMHTSNIFIIRLQKKLPTPAQIGKNLLQDTSCKPNFMSPFPRLQLSIQWCNCLIG